MTLKPLAAFALGLALTAAGCKSAPVAQQNPDGTVTNPNGSVTVPVGQAPPAGGAPAPAAQPQQYAIRNPDGSITNPDGSITYPAGSKVATNEGKVSPPPAAAPKVVYRDAPAAPAPAPAPAPVIVRRTAPAGTAVTVRTNGAITSHDTDPGSSWSGSLARPIVAGGTTIFPAGTDVSGTVVQSKGVGKFKGSGDLAIEVTSIGRERVSTSVYSKHQKGRGKRSAAYTAGGGGLGAIIGGLTGGGKGALIGGLAGAGGGAAAGSLTGSTNIVIPAESVITFRLTSSVTR